MFNILYSPLSQFEVNAFPFLSINNIEQDFSNFILFKNFSEHLLVCEKSNGFLNTFIGLIGSFLKDFFLYFFILRNISVLLTLNKHFNSKKNLTEDSWTKNEVYSYTEYRLFHTVPSYVIFLGLTTIFLTFIYNINDSFLNISEIFLNYTSMESLQKKFTILTTETFNLYSLDIIFCFVFIYLILFLLTKDSISNNTNTLIPNIYQYISEMIYKVSVGLFVSNLGKKVQNKEFLIKLNTILVFILISNVQGMIPYMSTLTSSLTNTFFVALALFISILIAIFDKQGWRYFLNLFMPEGCPIALIFLLIPIEVISYVFRVVSLSVRLFANMMAGHTLLKVIVGFSWDMILAGEIFLIINFIPVIALFILTLLEVGVAFIQTYIFTILSCIYLKDIFFGH